MLSISDLPEPLLLDVLEYLRPIDVLRCRRVSRLLYHSLTSQDLCRHLILSFFPRAREARLLRSLNLAEDEHVRAIRDTKDWAKVFSTLARRYHNLATAQPGTITKITPLKDPELLRAVTPWNRWLRRPELMTSDRVAHQHYPDPVWTYCKDMGLLVYPDTEFRYRALDVATGRDFLVPFETHKIVRRVRLNEGVLVFEWAEPQPFHELNTQEMVHRHFATAFDVQKHTTQYDLLPDFSGNPEGQDEPGTTTNETGEKSFLDITLRAEWKIHYLGLPLSDQDRFYSAHNATHYALYVWQHNRSPYWEDDPLERLIVWDISSSSPLSSPITSQPDTSSNKDATSSITPQVILRLTNADLDPWDLRQSDVPDLHSLEIDRLTIDPHTGAPTGHLFLRGEDHKWTAGPHSGSVSERFHCVKTIGVPLNGHGPIWNSRCWYPPERGTPPCPTPAFSDILDAEAFRPGAGDFHTRDDRMLWPGHALCWRHRLNDFIAVAEVLDPLAGVHIVAATDLETKTIRANLCPELRDVKKPDEPKTAEPDLDEDTASVFSLGDPNLENDEVAFGDEMWAQLLAKGVLEGDERWLIGEDDKGDITIVTF